MLAWYGRWQHRRTKKNNRRKNPTGGQLSRFISVADVSEIPVRGLGPSSAPQVTRRWASGVGDGMRRHLWPGCPKVCGSGLQRIDWLDEGGGGRAGVPRYGAEVLRMRGVGRCDVEVPRGSCVCTSNCIRGRPAHGVCGQETAPTGQLQVAPPPVWPLRIWVATRPPPFIEWECGYLP